VSEKAIDKFSFPAGFLWGVATSAYQIEGAWASDGKGESIWDRFSHTAGKIQSGDTGDIACDHYHRFAEDVALMSRLGVKAYRFSISWPRVIPDGRGSINLIGLDFYDRLVDTLLMKNIEPFITLYHWDLPQSLQELGGWANREIGDYFADYASRVVTRLGDRARYWLTLNEPWCIAFLGNRSGVHAPGIRNEKIAVSVSHNLLLAHGKAVEAIRSHGSQVKVGIANACNQIVPASNSREDIDAAELSWQRYAAWFLDPLLRGQYPDKAWHSYQELVPHVEAADLKTISQKLDFLGINFYTREIISAAGQPPKIVGSEYTELDWEVHPQSLRDLLRRLHDDYVLPPIYITENGAAFADVLSTDGHVHDLRRINYLAEHIKQVHSTIADGVDLRGYFVWSLLDNFEWAYGFSKRFGIVRCDFDTLKRTTKDSGRWYSQVVKQNGLES
jgi:beta-glucosidase